MNVKKIKTIFFYFIVVNTYNINSVFVYENEDTNKTEYYEEEVENMTIYGYKPGESVEENKIPLNTHEVIENEDYGIYFIDSTEHYVYHLNPSTGAITQLDGSAQETFSGLYHDRANDKAYYWRYKPLETDKIMEIDMTDNSISEYLDKGTEGFTRVFDLWLYDSDWWISYTYTSAGTTTIIFLNLTDEVTETTSFASAATSRRLSRITIVGDMFFFLHWDNNDDNTKLYKYDVGDDAWTKLQDCGAGIQLSSNKNLLGISYDDSDKLYFVLYDSGDSKNYLYTYEITADTLTKGAEYNIALMMNRNTDATNAIPFNLEKAFGVETGVNDLMVYQIALNRGHLYKIADLTNVSWLVDYPNSKIAAITDKYIFIDKQADVELWEYVE